MGRLGNEQDTKHKKVHQVLQSQKEAFDERLTQELEHVTCESDAKLDKNHEHLPEMQESLETRIRDDLLRIESERGAKERAEAQPRLARPPPWKTQDATEVVSLLWLALLVQRHEDRSHEGVKNVHLCMPTVHNTRSITPMMQKNWCVSGLLKKSKARVAKLNALNPQPVFGITSMSDKHPEESGNVARRAYHYSSRGTHFARGTSARCHKCKTQR